MNETTILFVIASEGFQHTEYSVPKQILEDAGFTVVTASDKPGTAKATNGSTTEVDITTDKVIANDYEGVFFIGGSDALEHLDNALSYKIIQETYYQNKPVGAICIATRILAKSGIMDGRYATGFNEDGQLEALYAEYHIQYLPTEKVVVNANIITATDPSAAEEFGKKIVEILHNRQSWG